MMSTGYVLWFTGLSGAGKTTLANRLHHELNAKGLSSYVLDGDRLRLGLNRDLDFSPEDRSENLRRAGEVSKILIETGTIVLAAFISPSKSDRHMIRQMFSDGKYIEVYVQCPLHVCESRDPKGLYKKARRGAIPDFTGITAAYEEPESPELVIQADQQSISACVQQILVYLQKRGILHQV